MPHVHAHPPQNEDRPAGVRTPQRAEHPLSALQRAAGNRAVSGMLAVQRVPVTVPDSAEHLYQNLPGQDPTTDGAFHRQEFGGGNTPGPMAGQTVRAGTYRMDMSRADGADPHVMVTVRIRFVHRALTAAGTPGTTDTEITDAERIDFANNLCTTTSADWTSKGLHFDSTRTVPAAPTPAPTGGAAPGADAGVAGPTDAGAPGGTPAPATTTVPVRLPVRFTARAVFAPAQEADATVALHPRSVTADPDNGRPINAGNYYMTPGSHYQGEGMSQEAIAAHEFGHLLGLDDEYSQANQQMHAMLHQMDPATAAARGAALDRQTVRRLVLAAMTRSLTARLSALTGPLAGHYAAARPALVPPLARGLREGAATGGVRTALTQLLDQQTAPGLHGGNARIAEFQTGANYSNLSLAQAGATAIVQPAAIARIVSQAFRNMLSRRATADMDVGTGRIGFDISGSVDAGTGVWGAFETAQAADTAAVADQVVGPTGAPVPAVAAPPNLAERLAQSARTWTPASVGAAVVGSEVGDRMQEALRSGAALAGAGTPIARRGEAFRRAHTLVQNMTVTAVDSYAVWIIQRLLWDILDAAVTDADTALTAGVDSVMGRPAGAVAAASPPDPHVLAVARTIHERFQAQVGARPDRHSQAVPRPVPAGAAGPPDRAETQEFNYTQTGTMGDNLATIRGDQFTELVGRFNASPDLKRADEADFTAGVG